MTKVVFYTGEKLLGFSVSGHSTESANDQNGRLVCAAVSSAAYMAANTVLEIIGDKSNVTVSDGEMELRLKNPTAETQIVLEGFKLHITELAKQYSNNIKISEV